MLPLKKFKLYCNLNNKIYLDYWKIGILLGITKKKTN